MAKRKAGNSATTGYEAELWEMADKLRGSMDAAEYKHVVLGLLFLKYISDAFEERHAEVLAEWGEAAAEDRDEYIAGDRTHRELTDDDIARIADTYHSWASRAESYADVPGFCRSAPLNEVLKHAHVLTPGRYVGMEPEEDDGEPFEGKMARFVGQPREQQTDRARLDAAIRHNLTALGFWPTGRTE